MLKPVLYYVMAALTVVRFSDIIYLLSADKTNLPVPVLVVTSLLIVFGLILTIKKFVGMVLLRQMAVFYAVNAVAILFNLTYTAVTSPLRISFLETLVTGTFLDVVVSLVLLVFCLQRLRTRYFAVEPQLVTKRHINV